MKDLTDKTMLTWREVVRDALLELGSTAHVKEIADRLLKHPKGRNNRHIHAKIRQVCQTYTIFQHVSPKGSGIYKLVDQEKEIPNKEYLHENKDNHGKIQGMLLEIGRVFGYQTIVSVRDMNTRTFQQKSISYFCTLKQLDDLPESSNLKRLKEIDVLWLYEHTNFLVPEYAFEVEDTTNIKDGMRRLINIYKPFKTRLYIIGPEIRKELYQNLLSDEIYRPYKEKMHFTNYKTIEKMFNASIDFIKFKKSIDFRFVNEI